MSFVVNDVKMLIANERKKKCTTTDMMPSQSTTPGKQQTWTKSYNERLFEFMVFIESSNVPMAVNNFCPSLEAYD